MRCFSSASLLILTIRAAWCFSDNRARWLLPRGDHVATSSKKNNGHSLIHDHHRARTLLPASGMPNNVIAVLPRSGKPPTQKQNSGNEGSRVAQPPNLAVRPFTFRAPALPPSAMESSRGRSSRRVADLVSKYEANTVTQPVREAGKKRPNPRDELQQLANAAESSRNSSPERPGTPRPSASVVHERLNQFNPSPLRRTSRLKSPERKLLKTARWSEGLDQADKLSQGNQKLTSNLDPLFKSPVRKARLGGGMSPESDLSEKLKQTHLFSTQDVSPFSTPERRTLSGREAAGSDYAARLKTILETSLREYTPWQSPEGLKVSEVPGAPRKLSRRAPRKTLGI